jgi:hypothetical protein
MKHVPAMVRFAAFVGVLSLGASGVASAQSAPGAGWSPAAGAAGDNTYQGYIDQPGAGATVSAGAAFHVSGWVVDTSAQGWAGIDGVQVMVGDRSVASGVVGISRPDVANAFSNGYWANSGFDAIVPAGSVPGGTQTLTVVAHTPGKGSWSKDVSVTVSGGGGGSAAPSPAAPSEQQTGLVFRVTTPAPNDLVLNNKNGYISGIAYDTRTRAELGIGVDRIQIYIDGPRGQAGSQFIGEVAGFGTTWSMSWEPTRYDSVRHHVMYAYGRSAVTGEEALVTVEFNIGS